MSTKVQARREAATFLATYAGAAGELLVDTTNNRVLVQDGATPGGFAAARLADLPGRNLIINGNFRINQRAYASGAALSNYLYFHDRWQDGTGNSNTAYTFTQGVPDTLITITAGALEQPVEPQNVAGGSYVLSWAGTCAMRIVYSNASGTQVNGASGPSPQAISGVPAGARLFAQTTSTGTLGLVQLEAGTVPTAFERRLIGTELALCQRYYQTTYAPGVAPGTANAAAGINFLFTGQPAGYACLYLGSFVVPMRAAPTLTFYSPVTGAAGKFNNNGTDGPAYNQGGASPSQLAIASAGATVGNQTTVSVHYTASAEL